MLRPSPPPLPEVIQIDAGSPRPLPFPAQFPLSAQDRRLFQAGVTLLAAKQGQLPTALELSLASKLSVAEIAGRFPSMEALLPATLTFISRGQGRGLYEASGGRGWAGLRVTEQSMRLMSEHPGLLEFYTRSLGEATNQDSPLHDWLTAQLKITSGFLRHCVVTGIEDGEISPQLDPEEVVRTILPLQFGAGAFWAFHGSDYDVADTMAAYVDLLQHRYGIGDAAR